MADSAVGRPWWWVGLGVMMLPAVWLHLRSGYVFPLPWPDESHFIAPALQLADFKGLGVPQLNAPRGIFWIPSGYYVAQVPLLWSGGNPLAMARLLGLLGVLAFAGTMAATAARAGVARWVCLAGGAVWLSQPRVVAAANMARMEGLLLGMAGLAVWLVSTDRWPAAVSVSLLAPLVHPVGAALPVAVLAAGLVRKRRRSWSAWECWLLALVSIAWSLELTYFLRNAELARAHLQFQWGRKSGREIVIGPWHRNLLVLSALGGAVATVRWWRAPAHLLAVWVSLALAGGLVLAEVIGRELWYEVLGRETAMALIAVCGLVVVRRVRWVPRWSRRVGVVATAVVLVLATAAGVRETVVHGWYRMRPDPAGREEWEGFVDRAVAALEDVDTAATRPGLVVVDPNSGFGPEIFSRNWQQLTFVQPTPATPMDTTQADYVLVTEGAPSVTVAVAQQWGPVTPTIAIRSAREVFTMELLANPTEAGSPSPAQSGTGALPGQAASMTLRANNRSSAPALAFHHP